jgi:hypothetical protein
LSGAPEARFHLEAALNPTRALHLIGQSLWLDNITRDLLEKGTLERYIEDLSVTGLTLNPTIFIRRCRRRRGTR